MISRCSLVFCILSLGAQCLPAQTPPRDANASLGDDIQTQVIAFHALAFFTGDLDHDTYLRPVSACDYFGFQFMRHGDRSFRRDSEAYLARIAQTVLFIMDESERSELLNLVRRQQEDLRVLARKRQVLITAFRHYRQMDSSHCSCNLNRHAIETFCADIYQLDARLAFQRALILGRLIRGFDTQDKMLLARLNYHDMCSWPRSPVPASFETLSPELLQTTLACAGELYSWYAGSLEADSYFCPDRHGRYFGSEALKHAAAAENLSFDPVSFLPAGWGEKLQAILTQAQNDLLRKLLDQQRRAQSQILPLRRAIAAELRTLQLTDTAELAKVESLARSYGRLDGEIAWYYARALSVVGRSLSIAQKQKLSALRPDDPALAGGPFLFSTPTTRVALEEADFLFIHP